MNFPKFSMHDDHKTVTVRSESITSLKQHHFCTW